MEIIEINDLKLVYVFRWNFWGHMCLSNLLTRNKFEMTFISFSILNAFINFSFLGQNLALNLRDLLRF
jgi:hypothetical protein